MDYIVWYKKEIKADNLKQAIQKESNVKPKFHSIQEVEDKGNELTPAIGFDDGYYPE